jgi:hypothetical protein
VYVLEFVVKAARFELHNLCVIAARPAEDVLLTLTVLAPEAQWTEVRL